MLPYKMSTEVDSSALFAEEGLSVLPRVLGLGDRDPASPTFGCFDRNYWHYRTTDFPCAWFQGAGLLMTLAHHLQIPENSYAGKPKLQDWSEAALDYLMRIQRNDGSFDEAYPYERSFCATAFSAYFFTEICLMARRHLPARAGRTAEWLSRQHGVTASNQLAAAICALENFARLTGEERFKICAIERLKELEDLWQPEGFYAEYGGFDLGYLSITLSLLSGYWQRTGNELVRQRCHEALDYMDGFIASDGTYDSSRMQRRTQFIYPRAFAVFGHSALEKVIRGLRVGRILKPSWLDDRYVVNMAIDYLHTSKVIRDVDDTP